MANELTPKKALSVSELDKFVKKIEDNVANIKAIALESAKMFASLPHFQLLEVKTRLSPILKSKVIDRLVLIGRGYPVHLCDPFGAGNLLSVSTIKRLPKDTLEYVSNPKAEVEVLSPQGKVKMKQAQKLSSTEWKQILDREGHLLTAMKQHAAKAPEKPKPNKDREVIERILPGGNGLLVIYGRQGGEMEGPVSMFRKYLA